MEAYSAMDNEASTSYKDLMMALLEKFDSSTETYRQRFRSLAVPQGESPKETCHRLKHLYQRWIKPEERTKEEVGELIVLEQLLKVLPAEVWIWFKEHEPSEGLQAAIRRSSTSTPTADRHLPATPGRSGTGTREVTRGLTLGSREVTLVLSGRTLLRLLKLSRAN